MTGILFTILSFSLSQTHTHTITHATGNNYGTCNNQAIPGQTCTFTCDPGYQLTGSGALTCGATGSWNPPTPPSCNRYSCPVQNPPVNGQISGQCIPGIVNEVCNFNCFPGYRRVGNQAITCQGEYD